VIGLTGLARGSAPDKIYTGDDRVNQEKKSTLKGADECRQELNRDISNMMDKLIRRAPSSC
jgi:hypothetical protein